MGNLETVDSPVPVPVTGPGGSGLLSNVVRVAAGSTQSLALKTDGTVWTWGSNSDGQLGDGSTADRSFPGSAPALTGAKAVAAGGFHSMAAQTDGKVATWGWNSEGQLGDGSVTTRLSPGVLNSPTNVVAVAAADIHTLALTASGQLWAWGTNTEGQLGVTPSPLCGGPPATQECSAVPVLVSGISGVTAIAGSTGGYFTLALRNDGTVWGSGVNNSGQLGATGYPNDRLTPGPVGIGDAIAIAAGGNFSLALKKDGTVVAVGDNEFGQLGRGTDTDEETSIVAVSGLTDVLAIAAGGEYALALKKDGTVWSWGSNTRGQLGATAPDQCVANSFPCAKTPVQVGSLAGISGIAAGGAHSVVFRAALAVAPAPVGSEFTNSPTTGVTSDPVNTYTGAFQYGHTDIAIAGRGAAPVFSRAYSTVDTRVGPLGPGWTHNYAMRLNDPGDATQDVILVGPDGRSDRYVRNPDGSYTPPPAIHTKLVKQTNEFFTATQLDQSSLTFNSGGQLVGMKDRHGNETSLAYDGFGRLLLVRDPALRGSLTFTHDMASGRLTKIVDWAGRQVTYEYDAQGRLWKSTDRENQTTIFGYDGTSHRLATITDALGHVAVTNTYDAQGRVSTQKDSRGLITGQQTLMSYGNPGVGGTTTIVFYPATSQNPAWLPKVEDTYDTAGRLIRRVSRPTSSASEDITEEFGYDAISNRVSYLDGRGNTTLSCFDVDLTGATIAGSRGNLTRRIASAPSPGANRLVALQSYDNKNNLLQAIPPRGVTSSPTTSCTTNLSGAVNLNYATDLVYDALQVKLLSVSRKYNDPDAVPTLQTATTKFEYDAAQPGQISKVIPPRGNTTGTPDYTYATSFVYYGAGTKNGMLQQVTDAVGNVTTYDYDSIGRRIAMVDPTGNAVGGVPSQHTWEYVYDNEDRPRFVKAPPPTVGDTQLITELRYDAVGNRTVVLDANGQVTKYFYDERDGLKEVRQSPTVWTDPLVTPGGEIVTEYLYDHVGNLQNVTRAKGDGTYERRVDYVYDGLNRLRTETQYPSWPSTSPTLVSAYTYDLNSNRKTMVDPLAQTSTSTYDALNRLTLLDYSDATTPDVTYTYDVNGNRLTMVDGTGTTSYTYDELDRLLSVTSPGPKTVGYRYDRDGNRTKVIYPDATAVTYTFDKASRLTSLLDWASRTTSYQYHPDGNLKQTTNVNSTSATYTYDNALRLTDVHNKKTNTISRHTYTLDRVGNRTQLVEILPQLGVIAGLDPFDNADELYLAGVTSDDLVLASPERAAQAPAAAVATLAAEGPVSSPLTDAALGAAEAIDPSTALLAASALAEALLQPGPTGTIAPTLAPTLAPSRSPTAATATASPTSAPTVASSPSPPASPVRTATPAGSAVPTTSPTPTTNPSPSRTPGVVLTNEPLVELPLLDQRTDATKSYQYAVDSNGYRAELFDKGQASAGVRLSHPESGATLSFALPGAASSRTVTGAQAVAQVGNATVRWTSYADRLKEDIILTSRPIGDQISFTVSSPGLTLAPDGEGGYVAYDAAGAGRFAILPATVVDAQGRAGAATLTISGARATIQIDPVYLSTATYPITVDPTTVYSGGSGDNSITTAYNNAPRLLRDSFGKVILFSRKGGTVRADWSNNGGTNWTGVTGPQTGENPSAALGPGETYIETAYVDDEQRLRYRRWTIARDGSNNITNLSAGPMVTLSQTKPERPAILMDKNGLPAVAWIETTGGSGEWRVRFLVAKSNPAVAGNWKNAAGTTTTADTLGVQPGGNNSGSVSLMRMPAGLPLSDNDDALYLFWVESQAAKIHWSRARVNGADYMAWTTPVDKGTVGGPSGDSWRSRLTTAADPTNRGIMVGYRAGPGSASWTIFRKQGNNDADASDVTLLDAAVGPALGDRASITTDRGDLYAFYSTASTGAIKYRRYLMGTGWDSAETEVDATNNNNPIARQSASDGQVDVVWAEMSPYALKHHRFAVSRPFITNLTATPNPFNPSSAQTTTISYTTSDNLSASLTTTIRVYDSGNTLVRTLVNGSQTVGNQNVVWDGKNDSAVILPNGAYTVKVNATDGESLAAPEQTLTVTLTGAGGGGGPVTTTYNYDRLYRLTGVTAPSSTTTYAYDPVGNRLNMTRGSSTAYTYDRADRITTAGATSYTVNANGNLVGRGADSFAYDQANRQKSVTIAGATSTYGYDGDGKRASKTVGGVTTSYVYDINRSLPNVLDDGTRKYVWGLGLAYAVNGASVEVHHTDGLGSVRAISDTAGTSVVQTYETDEFGVPTTTGGASAQPFRYTGEQRDAESGFMYLRARVYDPAVGRFTQRDAYGGAQHMPTSLQRYAYVGSNPIRFGDPSGLYKLELYYRQVVPGLHHAYIIVTDNDGSQRYYAAFPSLWPAPAGQIAPVDIPHGPNPANHDDWGAPVTGYLLLVNNTLPAAAKNKALTDYTNAVRAAGLTYYPLGANSNSFAHQAIEQVLGCRPSPPTNVTAPGWEVRLNVPGFDLACF